MAHAHAVALVLSACLLAWPAHAVVAPRDYRDAGVSLPNNAGVPLDAEVTDDSGHRRALGELMSGPAVLVFADYTCTTLCGPIVAFVAAALEKSGLRPVQDFRADRGRARSEGHRGRCRADAARASGRRRAERRQHIRHAPTSRRSNG